MAMDFSKVAQQAEAKQKESETTQTEVVAYDIVEDRKELTQTLENSPEVDALISTVAIDDMTSIVSFGAEAAEGLARASDVVLNSMSMSQLDETSKLLVSLGKIMDKFNIDEVKDDPSFFGKMFGNLRKKLDMILEKYTTMGAEVDKIYIELKKYEGEITQSNRKLNDLFQANVEYYHELVKYILAGEQGCREIEAYTQERRLALENSGDQAIQMELQTLEQALLLMEQRVHDLRIAENVALQSIPMIKTMEFTNLNLVRKINSAFIITLPVFKQALAQAIMLKRQKIQAEALSALDEKTNEMLIKNAKNTVEQSKMAAKLASGSSVKMETLETTWRTIVSGIEETKQIQENARKTRSDDQVRLEQIKKEFEKNYHVPSGS